MESIFYKYRKKVINVGDDLLNLSAEAISSLRGPLKNYKEWGGPWTARLVRFIRAVGRFKNPRGEGQKPLKGRGFAFSPTADYGHRVAKSLIRCIPNSNSNQTFEIWI